MKKLKFPVKLSLISLGIMFLAISSPEMVQARQQKEMVKETSHASEGKITHWGYEGANNPTEWGKLNPEFATCAVGEHQSPIDIHSVEINPVHQKSVSANMEFNYQPTPLTVANTGHNVQVNYTDGSSVKIGGREYKLSQFHFHTPSEHTLNGEAYAMEAHLVHQDQNGEYAVVSLLIEPGTENKQLKNIWDNIPETGNVKAVSNATINVADLLPESTSNYHYIGSLTTPPCSEGVNWYVLREPIQASPEQIEQFTEFYSVNARPTQPLNDRAIDLEE